MRVIYSERLDENHSIEIGWSTWDDEEVSIRNRYEGPTGRFSPRGSSEISLSDFTQMMRVVLERLPEVVRAREATGVLPDVPPEGNTS
jgi:hypothetical protein